MIALVPTDAYNNRWARSAMKIQKMSPRLYAIDGKAD